MHLHENSDFTSKIYFGCGIMEIKDAQDKKLGIMNEKPLARKLGLGSNFTRKIFHGRSSEMGVRIVAPKTAITALSLNLCLSHRRMQSENGKIINLIENNQMIEMGPRGKNSI